MRHLSENNLTLQRHLIEGPAALVRPEKANLEFIIYPCYENLESVPEKDALYSELKGFLTRCHEGSTIAVLTSPVVAADFCATNNIDAHLKLWIAVKESSHSSKKYILDQRHSALLIFTKHNKRLKHTKTRIAYTYCPVCDKTTKDYGGKKHLYHEFGTLVSDVWRDIQVNWNSNLPDEIISRLQDLFGLPEYSCINIYDERSWHSKTFREKVYKNSGHKSNPLNQGSNLFSGDCLEVLHKIPDGSIDFCFADPPYNLKKKYEGWDDGLDIKEYFAWCDNWLTELGRVLKPGRTLAVLNIPQWCIRYFKHLTTILDYQDWIVWESMSMPVRMIMPSHYSILCFSKGKPKPLPGLLSNDHSCAEIEAVTTIKENYCARSTCVKNRKMDKTNHSELVSNLWWDIHRLKHNSRRVDHPCQLPPLLMRRLISLFTNAGEVVLDPFNGVGTTTLVAEQLNRRFIGIEISDYYHEIAKRRHGDISQGKDPFRKNGETVKAKNSPVKRLKKQKYEVAKKDLQLEVKKITKELGHIPTKDEVAELSKYPIKYYEEYFINWGEVTAAARTTGMTEYKNGKNLTTLSHF